MSIYRSIEVLCSDVPFDRLPADIRHALSDNEAVAYREGPGYFLNRSANCSYRPLQQFFQLLGRRGAFRLHLYAGLRPQFRVFYGFSLLGMGASGYVQVRLASGVELPGDPPSDLLQLYQVIGGVIDGQNYGGENYGGWVPPEDVRSVGTHQWQPTDTSGFDVDQSYPVYSFGNGDYAGYAGGGRGFLYDHERHILEPWDLLDYAEEYFGDYPRTLGE
jgi:hypothetical protein